MQLDFTQTIEAKIREAEAKARDMQQESEECDDVAIMALLKVTYKENDLADARQRAASAQYRATAARGRSDKMTASLGTLKVSLLLHATLRLEMADGTTSVQHCASSAMGAKSTLLKRDITESIEGGGSHAELVSNGAEEAEIACSLVKFGGDEATCGRYQARAQPITMNALLHKTKLGCAPC